MVYQQKYVACIKVNGKVLREINDAVTLPFGCEYSILIKNLNSVRSQIAVSVDGKDATDGTKLIIAPNGSIELERFIRNGNLAAGNRFKFIERTSAIENHRGIGVEDGIVRIEAWTERKPAVIDETIIRKHYIDEYDYIWPQPWPWPPRRRRWNDYHFGSLYKSSGPMGATDSLVQAIGGMQNSATNFSCSVQDQQQSMQEVERSSLNQMSARLSDAGITVPGGESRQQFYQASGFELMPQSTVLVLHLRGDVGGKAVSAPVTVKAKPTCSSCGKVNLATTRFCGDCGTALELI